MHICHFVENNQSISYLNKCLPLLDILGIIFLTANIENVSSKTCLCLSFFLYEIQALWIKWKLFLSQMNLFSVQRNQLPWLQDWLPIHSLIKLLSNNRHSYLLAQGHGLTFHFELLSKIINSCIHFPIWKDWYLCFLGYQS